MISLYEVIEYYKCNGKTREEYWFALRNLLDHFNRIPTLYCVLKEPNFDGVEDDYIKAFTAGVCDYLCNKANLIGPDWSMKDEYFLKEPYFSCKPNSRLKPLLLLQSPNEFRVRQIFIDKDSLSRA